MRAVLSKTWEPGKIVTDEEIDIMQKFMDATAEFHIDEINKILMANPGMSEACASDVSYLRTRSRWSKELEQRLIREHAEGKKINICDWPDHSDRGEDPFPEQK